MPERTLGGTEKAFSQNLQVRGTRGRRLGGALGLAGGLAARATVRLRSLEHRPHVVAGLSLRIAFIAPQQSQTRVRTHGFVLAIEFLEAFADHFVGLVCFQRDGGLELDALRAQ